MPKVTIEDIASKAGVSKTSVSFAFNNPERLSETTLKHILRVAEELGYNPDPIASNLKTGRTGCIGLLMPQPLPNVARNPHTLEFIEGIGEICHDSGTSLMLVPPLKGSLRRAIVRAAVDGFVTMGLEPFRRTIAVLQQRGVPFVTVDSDPTHGLPCVNVDDEKGAYHAMRYVLERHHRHIAILGIRSEHSGKYQDYTGLLRRRISGYVRALDEFGLSIDDRRVRLIECSVEAHEGERAFRSLWRPNGWQPTAVVAMADILLLGVLQAAHDLGLKVPGDISLMGFDDIEFSALAAPALTTIRQPTAEKGRVATRMLLDLIEGRVIPTEPIVLPVEFIERDSVAPVR
jgi:DNA-binding LacI/PurR family transcriptional regulator